MSMIQNISRKERKEFRKERRIMKTQTLHPLRIFFFAAFA